MTNAPNFMLVVSHAPLYASPDTHFSWPPKFFRWKWVAVLAGYAAMLWYPHATEFAVFLGRRVA